METNNEKENADIKQLAGVKVSFTIPDTESLGALDNMDASLNLRLKYKKVEDWEKEVNKPIRVWYLGLRQIPNENQENVLCALFASAGEIFLAGQKVLVDAVSPLPATDIENNIRTGVQITYLGKQTNKTNENETCIFDIQKLG